jgi:hypothetical protein
MRESSRELPPVRLANPTAESFVASLKVVHFFAVVFFWLILVAMLVHLGAFAAIQSGYFDSVLRPAEPQAAMPAASSVSAAAPAASAAMKPQLPAPPGPDSSALQPATPQGSAVSASAAETITPNEPASAEARPWWNAERARDYMPLFRQTCATMRLVGLLCSALLLVTLFVYLEISLLGRLAGVRYLTMSFFLMLFFAFTVYSWEPLLPGNRIVGSLFTLDDLLNSYTVLMQRGKTLQVNERIFYYVRFLALPLLSFVLLVFSWLRFRRGYEESVLMNE